MDSLNSLDDFIIGVSFSDRARENIRNERSHRNSFGEEHRIYLEGGGKGIEQEMSTLKAQNDK
jgi:hypothetical protein